jgi:hypothetical protein
MSSIDTVVDYMDGANLTDHWKDFLSFTASSDREFGDAFTRAAPELAALLAESGLWNG